MLLTQNSRASQCDCSFARWSTFSNSRPVRGPEPRGKTKMSRRSSLCKVRQDVGQKLAFPQQLSEKLHVETWAGGCPILNLGISQDQEIEGRCAVVGFSPRTPCVTPVLPGPGSDIRMKMGWKIKTKTANSGVWSFQSARIMWGRWVLPLLTGAVVWVWKGSYRTAWAVPCGSSCSCSYSYGRAPAVGSHAGERRWPLLAGVWRAIAPLMKPWCAEGEVPTAANLNLYRGWKSCVRWHSDDEPLFGGLDLEAHCFGEFWVSSVLQMEGQVLSGR